MTRKLPTPPVPDLARAKGGTVPELVEWFVKYYNQGGAPFNYRRGTKAVRSAYKGLHSINLLTAGCVAEVTAIGRTANSDLVRAVAPLAFGRDTQVFDLSRGNLPSAKIVLPDTESRFSLSRTASLMFTICNHVKTPVLISMNSGWLRQL